MSSTISLSAETVSMKMSGTSVVYLPVGETSGICCGEKAQVNFGSMNACRIYVSKRFILPA